MAIESFVITEAAKCPSAIVSNSSRNGQPKKINFKSYVKGEVIKGELKHSNNKPAFVLAEGAVVVPLNIVKKVVAETIKTSSADGATETTPKAAEEKKEPVEYSNPKIKYFDAMIIGGLLGLGATYGIEKKFPTWLPVDKKKECRIGGILLGAAAGWYFVYRNKGIKPVAVVLTKKD